MRKIAMPALLAGTNFCAPNGLFARPKADVSDPKAMIGQIQNMFEEFKSKNDEHIDAKFKDVVRTEEVERINNALSELQTGIDDLARRSEAQAARASEAERIADADYTGVFNTFIRKGEDGNSEVKAALGQRVQAAATKGVAADGGFLVPVEWDRTIQDKLVELSPWRSLCTVQTVAGGGFKKLYNLHGATSGWVGETAARPETGTSTLGEFTFSWGELYANPAASQQLIEDAEIDVEAWLSDEVALEFAKQEGTAFTSGNGTNRPQGILNYVTGGSAAGTHPLGNIALVNSGNAALLNGPDTLIKTIYDLPTIYQQNASFAMNRATLKDVRLMKDGQNNYIWQPSYQQGQPSTIAGFGVTEMQDMPNIAANAIPILFGDFKRAYLILDRIGTQVLRDPYTNKPYVMFYTRKRVGGGLNNPEVMRGVKIAV